ncbi:MAG: hypothetical protein WAW80_04590 [Candidatus Saccharimonadales bacterium]
MLLRTAGLIALCVALTTTLFFGATTRAVAGVNQTLSFQGRLQSSSGSIVPDGHYNFQFKLYQDGAGTASGNPGGTLKWTESYVNNNSNSGVDVKNGYFSVNLGSNNPFGSSVDWNQDTLWLSMNVAGTSANCTTFGTAPCSADGEMLPMKRITSTPYSLNSGAVGGKTADQLAQLGQGVQTDASNNSSIYINKTGSGNLLQLQNTSTNVFSIGNTGDLLFGSNDNHMLSIEASLADTAGKQLTVEAGTGGSGSGSTGGELALHGGSAGGTNANGGNVSIEGGNANGSGADGSILIGSSNNSSVQIGNTNLAGGSQEITIGTNANTGGTTNVTVGSTGSAAGGSTTVQSKDDLTLKTNGTTRATFSSTDNSVVFGNGTASPTPNDFKIQGTNSSASLTPGGSLTIQGGDATAGDANGGDVTLSGGNGSGTGVNGSVIINTPTFSTTTSDANCYTGGTPVASNCTIATSSINNSAATMVGFSTTGRTASLPDPTITTAGRIIYIMASDTSENFTLSANSGSVTTTMRPGTAISLIWNGTDWITTDALSSSSNIIVNNDTLGGAPSVRIGDGGDATELPTLMTLDKADTTPTISDSALLGSMYYDTTLGKVQCYEADGWGACGAAPDTFITLSPQYANAVMNGADIGTITSDLCSDTLNINDGSSSQPTVCGTNETYNFYKWTSAETTTQTRGIYVTYQLPSNFKNFVAGTTSLMGRTDHADSAVTYQIYRDDGTGSTGLTSCGSAISVSTGSQTTWQQATASGSADPANCSFEAGDSILVRINLSTKSNANAYVSNLNFVFNSN